jgi:hypothetical protein
MGSKTDFRKIPTVLQQVRAEMLGTTRPWIDYFMNKFRKRGSSGSAAGSEGCKSKNPFCVFSSRNRISTN